MLSKWTGSIAVGRWLLLAPGVFLVLSLAIPAQAQDRLNGFYLTSPLGLSSDMTAAL